MLARPVGCEGPISNKTLMNTDASKSSLRNHSSKMSKMARSWSSGSSARLRASRSTQPCVQTSSRRWRKARKVVLGREVPIQRGLGHARGLDDLVDPDRLDPPPGEQLVGRRED